MHMGDRSPASHLGGTAAWPTAHSAFVYWVLALWGVPLLRRAGRSVDRSQDRASLGVTKLDTLTVLKASPQEGYAPHVQGQVLLPVASKLSRRTGAWA